MKLKRFLFYFKNIANRERSEDEKDLGLLGCLFSVVFDFYYSNVFADGVITAENRNYRAVKYDLIGRFETKKPQKRRFTLQFRRA